ncbi:MAG TPA: glycoside hydrolase family 2 TIM barrel-domain containing protein [Chitinophaga sp.]|uniref:glycoside hydrolase family 2 protein n=1 Tax=Chitinophaga sp. TaxID=1869181 RepID=UPI002D0A736A|nr:sugar-binding domain-containing protein [Chitinophaga sp.]HVI44924.1 glycoside hydrolase family 2 TIM barrel-domain containing protein [Chitinophaga sp.]
MMKNVLNVLILSGITSVSCYAQGNTAKTGTDSYKIQPVVMQSRWAKEVSPANALKEYPRPQLVRKNWQNLNGLWEYAIKDSSTAFPTSYQGTILVPFPLESALSGVKKSLMPDQQLWYKKNIQKPTLAPGERLLLHFGAVDWQATIFLNGKEVGQHTGGYQHFTFDITDFLKPGANELLVKVYDPTDDGPNPHGKQVLNPADIYYTPSSGIWQTVWTEKVPSSYISSIKATPDIDKGILHVNVNAEGSDAIAVEVTAKANGKVISTQKQSLSKNNKTATADLSLSIPGPHLWSPEDPFLYDISVRLVKGTGTVDQVESYAGMRKITIQKDEKGVDRIFLNNKYTYNLGTLDQGFWPDGLYTAPTDEALAFDIKAIKAMGFNTIRKHIKVEPERWYYHADKTGVLVWQDFVNPPHHMPGGAKAAFEKEAQETMEQLHNHPSIVTWVLFNERWGAYDQQRLTEWVKKQDPSRIVNGHTGELLYVNEQLRAPSDNPWVSSDMTDVHSYPDPMNAPAQPGKARVLGEFGGIGVSVPNHEWNDLQGWGYIQITPAELKGKYEIMTKRLKKLETEGLSASIYTQPFDVEGEENGILTYDREIIKIPANEIREINSMLIEQAKGYTPDSKFVIARNMDLNDNDNRYNEFLSQYEQGKHDSAFLRRLTLMALRKQDQPNTTKIGNTFISTLTQPFSRDNLTFIRHITRTSNDKGFQMFLNDQEKINAVLGPSSAQSVVKQIINNEEIAPYIGEKHPNPDWDAIQQRVTKKYGTTGEEYVIGRRMLYYFDIAKDWKKFGEYYMHYYKTALKHSDYNINTLSWFIFEKVNDPKILNFAVDVSKYNIEKFDPTPEAWDTYANLLYKTGKHNEAIEWERKALQEKKGSEDEKVYAEALDKMQKGLPTWPQQ